MFYLIRRLIYINKIKTFLKSNSNTSELYLDLFYNEIIFISIKFYKKIDLITLCKIPSKHSSKRYNCLIVKLSEY